MTEYPRRIWLRLLCSSAKMNPPVLKNAFSGSDQVVQDACVLGQLEANDGAARTSA